MYALWHLYALWHRFSSQFYPKMQQQYGRLAVLLNDMPAPLPVLETLWNIDEAEARRIGRRLADRSLAQRDDESGIRLHDLQLDYIRAKVSDREALDLTALQTGAG